MAQRSHSLDSLAFVEFGHEMVKLEEVRQGSWTWP